MDVLLVHALPLVVPSSSHTNFRMEKFDEHQNLRLLWAVFPARPTLSGVLLLEGAGVSHASGDHALFGF